jgi:hypothetical protein
VDVRYPTREDWLHLLANPEEWQGPEGLSFIGAIADLLQLAEECKKGSDLSLAAFEEGCKLLLNGPIVSSGLLHIRELDQETLMDAMFDVDFEQGEAGIRYWSEVATKDIRPWRTLRRLLLRPLYHWFEDEPYRQMEAYFGEEPGRNA